MKNESALAEVSISIASQAAAAAYLARHANVERMPPDLFEFIKAELKNGISAALDDAKEALACRMEQVAEHTITICGINAAKAWLAAHPEVTRKNP